MTVGADRTWRYRAATFAALAVILIGYPAFRMAVSYLDIFQAGEGREGWWGLWGVMLAGHWLCLAVCAAAIASEGGGWASIGLNWSFFRKGRFAFLLIVIAAAAAAYFAPGYFYGDETPARMASHPFGPVSAGERIFWIAMAVTAGVVEEILYRGYAITRLGPLVGWPLAVVVPALSFAFMHGPSAFEPVYLGLYLGSALLFSAAFLAMRRQRLELLILAHVVFDLVLVGAP